MRTCCWMLLSLMLALPADAQETRGNISGTVKDSQGVVPGATVTVTSADTGVSQPLVTNSSGYFEFPLVQPGAYQIAVAMAGYKSVTRPGIVVAVGQQVSVQFVLELGQITEQITVTAESPLLDTSAVSSGQNFDSRMVEGLPMFSNMPIMLTRFASGVNPSTSKSLVWQGFADGKTQAAGGAIGGGGRDNHPIEGAPNQRKQRRDHPPPYSPNAQQIA